MNLWGILLIIVGGILVVKPQWGAKYLEQRMKISLIQRHIYNKVDDKEKLRKQLKIGSIILGIFIIAMGLFVLFLV